jgi:hypothetical protein
MRDALALAEQRRLLDVGEDGDDDRIKNARAALDDVDMAAGERVERSGIDGNALGCGHE